MHRFISAVAIAALTISLTGCGAGFNASTRNISQVTDGAESSVIGDGNNLRVVNMLVIAVGGGTGVLVGTIVNAADTEDTLLGVAINGTVLTYTGENKLPKNTPIIFEGDRANAKAVINGFGAKPGTNVSITMFFARAGEVTKDVIVRDNTLEYTGITG